MRFAPTTTKGLVFETNKRTNERKFDLPTTRCLTFPRYTLCLACMFVRDFFFEFAVGSFTYSLHHLPKSSLESVPL